LLISTPSDQGGSDAQEEHDSFIGEHVRDGYAIKEIEEKLNKVLGGTAEDDKAKELIKNLKSIF